MLFCRDSAVAPKSHKSFSLYFTNLSELHCKNFSNVSELDL